MVVRSLGSGRDVRGLYIGARNARRHFPKQVRHIELYLGHLHIFCDLMPEFWSSRPEICDGRLGDWLFSRLFHGKACRAPVPVTLIPAGESAYRIVPFYKSAASTNQEPQTRRPRAAARLLKKNMPCEDTICRVRTYITCPMRQQN